jgi:hypothetical protein
VRCGQEGGGGVRERYRYITVKGMSKKKTIVGTARRLGELAYVILRSEGEYEPRPWKGGPAHLAEESLSA